MIQLAMKAAAESFLSIDQSLLTSCSRAAYELLGVSKRRAAHELLRMSRRRAAPEHLYSTRDIFILEVSCSIHFVARLSDLRIVQLLQNFFSIYQLFTYYIKTNL